MENPILMPYTKGALNLKNHLVMAPMTRSRAIDNIPNDMMAEYYGQRDGAGLIITEGTSPAPEGLGYPRIPGMYSDAQTEGWKKTTSAVHKGNSRIFVQLMHTGRIASKYNLPKGYEVIGVSNIKAAGQMHTDAHGTQDYPEPVALTTQGVKNVIDGYVNSAKKAVEAGFDGIELHAANGYLIEQFLNPNVNNRTDEYGGNYKARSLFVLEIAQKVAYAIGKDKIGIRFSPYSTMGDLKAYDENEVHETYVYLATELNKIGIAYIHIGFSPDIPKKTLDSIRSAFGGTIIMCNGLTPETAVTALQGNFADLVAFGRSFLANPDLDQRIADNATLNQPDFNTLYTPGAKGYTDYPALELIR
jgi:N-ethylmaleimide reductase